MNLALQRMGLRVKLLREAEGLSQSQFARLCRLSRPTISYLEIGRVQTRMSSLEAVADALDVTVEVLMGFEPMPGGVFPEVKLTTRHVVSCSICGRLLVSEDRAEAEVEALSHEVPHPKFD